MTLIGTDSKVHAGYIRFCTCILDTETGLLEKHYEVTRSMDRSARLHNEAALTLKHAAFYQDAEMHFDFSQNPKHKSYSVYQAWKGIQNGKFKPEAFMATSVADYFLDH